VTIDLRPAKNAAMVALPAGHPGRALLLAQPDSLDEPSFDALLPSIVRLLRAHV
jgi:hypothetical protein